MLSRIYTDSKDEGRAVSEVKEEGRWGWGLEVIFQGNQLLWEFLLEYIICICWQVWYQIYDDDSHDIFVWFGDNYNGNSDFTPTLILKVTWENMAPIYSSALDEVCETRKHQRKEH